MLAVLVCNVAVPCWFACQRAATVRVTVLPVQGGRFACPSTRSPSLSLRVDSCTARVTDKRRLPAYTYTPSGSSPAQLASPCFGPFRSALRNCGFVPKPCFWGLSAQPSASPLKTLRVFRRLPGPDRGRAWHLWSSSARCSGSRPLSRSMRRRSRRLHGDTRRNASSVNTPPRLATCLTAHPTNRVAACRSVRHSPPRPLPHLP